jgi:hypothetical protein
MCLESVGSVSEEGMTELREARDVLGLRFPAILRRPAPATFAPLTARVFVRAFDV